MSYAISVPTPFDDVSDLAENFAPRVDEERVMLPHGEAIPEGEWVEFAVTLGDGTAALAGTGRCTGSYDNGDDRAPEHRFDVVLDSLHLDEIARVYFERILMFRNQHYGEPPTGEVEAEVVDPSQVESLADSLAPAPASDAPVSDTPAEIAESWSPEDAFGADSAAPAPSEEPTAAPVVRESPVRESPAAPAPLPVEPGELPKPNRIDAVLTRPDVEPGWRAVPAPRPEPRPSSGAFAYGSMTLPQPAEPPRPELDPALVVQPAPRPGDAVDLGPLGFGAVPGATSRPPAEPQGVAPPHVEPETETVYDPMAATGLEAAPAAELAEGESQEL
ncbi:MAG: hypothetical protein ACFCGT_02760 [Sandaracinaceae bacterium]